MVRPLATLVVESIVYRLRHSHASVFNGEPNAIGTTVCQLDDDPFPMPTGGLGGAASPESHPSRFAKVLVQARLGHRRTVAPRLTLQ
jgi:hypothetical protein